MDNALGWRASFATSALIGFIGLSLAMIYLPETNQSERQSTPLKTFIHSAKAFWHSSASIVGAVLVGLSFGAMMAYITTSSDLLIRQYGISPFLYAVTFSVAAAGYMLGGFSSRQLAANKSPIILIQYSAIAYLLSAALLLLYVGIMPPLWLLMVGVFCYFASVGSMLSLATAYTLAPLPKSAGMGTAILGCFQMFVGATTSTVLASLNLNHLESLLWVLITFALAIGIWVFSKK